MPLLGWPLQTVSIVLLVGVTVGTLSVWSRVPGRGVLRLAQRAALVVGCQLAAVLLVAVAANNYGYFYGSWGDLFGTSMAEPVVVSAGWPQGHLSRGLVVPAVTVARPTSWSPTSAASVRGKVESVRIPGVRSGLTADALVYLPPQYFQPAYAHHQFPAIEMLTGYPGVTASLVSRLHVPEVYLAELQHHRAIPMVIVMLRPTVAPPRDTECTDVPAGPQALTYLARTCRRHRRDAAGASHRVGEQWGSRPAGTARSSSPCSTGMCSGRRCRCPGTTTRSRTRPRATSGWVVGAAPAEQPGVAARAPAAATGLGAHVGGAGRGQRSRERQPLVRLVGPAAHDCDDHCRSRGWAQLRQLVADPAQGF